MSLRHNGRLVGKQVRAFNLDYEIGAQIDSEAALLGPREKSALVNELLREALERRKTLRYAKTSVQVGEVVATIAVSIFLGLAAILVFS